MKKSIDDENDDEVSSTKGNSNHAVYQWQEVTTEFFESIKELSLGELMHNNLFGLFEAMSAIEMMDPKMDAGMCCNKDTPQPLNFQTAVSVSLLNLIFKLLLIVFFLVWISKALFIELC